ncbi:MAG: hypothetical protein E7587_06350 [Ruminococcaceae bacterium]|nr:hypothetical protein [Oscillospiraceae bacterium]
MRAAFYECDITPPLGENMPGGYCENRAMDVFEPLYAKAVVIEDGDTYAAIVAIDTCEVNPQFHDVITKRVHEYTGISPESVCVHVVHTHKGAPTEHRPECGQGFDPCYTDVCMRRAADAIILAYKRLQDDVEAKFGCGTVEGISFNRNYVVEDGEIRSFSTGGKKFIRTLAGIDPELPVLTFMKDGKPIGAIISFACHLACTGKEVNGYSGDYAGILSQELKKQYGPEFISVFLIGAAGDINQRPNDPSRTIPPFWYREMGKFIAREAIRIIDTDSKPIGEGISIKKEQIDLPVRNVTLDEACRQIEKWAEQKAMMRLLNLAYYYTTNKLTHDLMWLQVIRIGKVCIYVMSGEIYVNFGLKLKKESPFEYNIVVSNSNSYGGYIPTPEAFAEGSDLYEISLCEGSRHAPEAGEMMVKRLLEMSKELYL